MASFCIGHGERENRKNKVNRALESKAESPVEYKKVLIKKGPISFETSLKELEEDYASKPEWKVIADGGVLSVPVEEFRMSNLPKPRQSGHVDFGKKRGKKAGYLIESYSVGQTVSNLKDEILKKYISEKERVKASGKSNTTAEINAQAWATKLPEFLALQKWLDIQAEIKVKKALEQMMVNMKTPALIIRSLSLRAVSALKDLGLRLSGEAEIDLVLAFVSGVFLHVVICEVKRADTYPWSTSRAAPSRQAVNKAELQLTKDVDIMMDILAGTPPGQVIIRTLACFPDASSSDLQTIFCSSCLENVIICQEDLSDLSLLQEKVQVLDKPNPATRDGMKSLLSLSARCLSHQSLLHVGYREVHDKAMLVTGRHKYNLESVDSKMMQKEYVVASPQQQQVIASFTASATARHLVLEGSAGTGKTLVALQVANSLIESASDSCEMEGEEPLLVVTVHKQEGSDPIMKYLDASTQARTNKLFKGWNDLLDKFGVSNRSDLFDLAEALATRLEGRHIVLLVDEIQDKEVLRRLGDPRFPESVRMILILNPQESKTSLKLPPTVFHVTLTTPYRSTISITALARFMAKFKELVVPEGEFGSDVEGTRPIFFEVGKDEIMLKAALEHCRRQLTGDTTFLFDNDLPSSTAMVGRKAAGSSMCFNACGFYGWEAERVVAVTSGGSRLLEMITRARIHLAVVLVDCGLDNLYERTMEQFQHAAAKGLVEFVSLSKD